MKHFFRIAFIFALFHAPLTYAQGIEAGSWGGKVRAGPGTNFNQVSSLQNGDPVRLLEDTRIMFNGYPWYRISYKGGRTGYQWGGILCGYGNPVGGTFGVCERDNRRAGNSNGNNQRHGVQKLSCSAEGRTRSQTGDVATSISFSAEGENDETQFKIYWLDYQGHRQFYKHIFAGDTYHQSTFMTHPWVVTAPIPGGGEDCLAIYLPASTPQSVVLR